MSRVTRRSLLAATAAPALPLVARAQAADGRPTITVAVQRIATSNTLDNI
jgi:hypothetical protein